MADDQKRQVAEIDLVLSVIRDWANGKYSTLSDLSAHSEKVIVDNKADDTEYVHITQKQYNSILSRLAALESNAVQNGDDIELEGKIS